MCPAMKLSPTSHLRYTESITTHNRSNRNYFERFGTFLQDKYP